MVIKSIVAVANWNSHTHVHLDLNVHQWWAYRTHGWVRSSCMIGTLHAVLKLRLLSGQAHAVALEGGRRVCLLQHLDNVDYKRKNSNRTPNNSKPSSLQRLWTRRLLWSEVVFSDSPELTLPRRTRSASSFSDRTRARCSCSRPSFSCAYYTCQSSSTGVPSSPVTC